MRILHTSDWHIGRSLYGRERYAEYEKFLDWLADALDREAIDALLVSGDVFDTSTPSNRAQALYYRFLCRVAQSSRCRHVVVIAGNHDSPSFLNASRELLRALHVYVVGNASLRPEDEVLLLRDARGVPELVVCAVPYLRDRDIRTAEAGESWEDKERKLAEGIRAHYAAVAECARRVRAKSAPDVPIVAMGHLFVAGGKTVEGDGVRELYVGSLAHVAADVFSSCFAYCALGHLHVPQRVGEDETVRYSGSPLPIGFGEAGQRKSVCRVDFRGPAAEVRRLEVPKFQDLERISGNWNAIAGRLAELSAAGSRAWLEIAYQGTEVLGDLRERLEAAVAGTGLEILRVRDERVIAGALEGSHAAEELAELDENEVFERCLEQNAVPEEQRPELRRAYRETLASLAEDDANAE